MLLVSLFCTVRAVSGEARSAVPSLCYGYVGKYSRCTRSLRCRHFQRCLEVGSRNPLQFELIVTDILKQFHSTVSSGLNSLAAIILEDFVRPFCCTNMDDVRATKVSKFLAIFIGLFCFALVFIAAQLGNVLQVLNRYLRCCCPSRINGKMFYLQAALSIFGMIGGPLLGVFTLGIFFPWANAIVTLTA